MINSGANLSNVLVTIVVTCFNNEKTIFKAIRSALDQSHRNLEVIVIDDCSEDGSREVIGKILDPRLKVIHLSKNSGVSAARNRGYDAASGLYITQLDGDDYLHEDKITSELTVATARPGSAAFSRHLVIKDKKIKLDLSRLFRPSPVLSLSGALFGAEYSGRDWLIPAEVAKQLRFNDKRCLYEDFEYSLKVLRKCNVIFIRSIGTYYVKHHSSLSSRPWSTHRRALVDIFNENVESKFSRAIFLIITYNIVLHKIFRIGLNWTRIYKILPL